MTLCIFMYETDPEEMWKPGACLACSYPLPRALMDGETALTAQARLAAAAGKQYKELRLAGLIQ